jgi:hypothetical protein
MVSNLLIFFQHNTETPSQINKTGKRNTRDSIGMEVVKLSLFEDDVILYLIILKNFPENS